LIDELARSAQDALEKGGFDNVEVVIGDGSKGYEEAAPYDRISVACGAPEIPKPMIDQLKKDGKILIPVGGQYYQTLYRATKLKEDEIKKEDLGGVLFVPLKGEYGY
ncbi:MAG: protein-L-isoaspartate O-methyltransferase, partial [Thermoplasmatota archaeon]